MNETKQNDAAKYAANLSYLSAKTIVRQSAIQGKGLFAVEDIAEGEIVVIKGGYIFDRQTLRQVSANLGPAEIQIADNLFIGPLNQQEREGSMIFSNHSCEPNIGVQAANSFSSRCATSQPVKN
ncbi:MAG: SET domain-containing protein-lysine N-methyltransferase [Pyrinomonadaceae bacterium]